MNLDTATSGTHQGRNIKRLREMLGIKQEALAVGLNISQQAVSKIENRDLIEEEVLQRVSDFLHIPVEAIKNFNDEGALNFVANTFNQDLKDTSVGFTFNFNPIDKIVELYNEKQELYERMLKDKNELIEKLLNK